MMELALFEEEPSGALRLIGLTRQRDLVEAVRRRLAAAQRRQLARLEGTPRVLDSEPEPEASM